MFSRRFVSAGTSSFSIMICLNMDGRNFESDAGIIREQEVRIMQNGKTKGILLHGFITKEEISIIMNTGLIMILTEKGNW